MDLKRVRELIKLVEESGIDEIEISGDGDTIRIRKSPQGGATAYHPVHVAAPAAAPGPEPEAAPASAAAAGLRELRSPVVGTFYRSPSPEAAPFVSVGDHVGPGQTVCIVEAMKVMNEIEAEFSGVVREILVENGAPVEAESVLFLVDPD